MDTETVVKTFDPGWYDQEDREELFEKNGRINPSCEERCIACNRPVTNWRTGRAKSVHMTTYGHLFPVDDDTLYDSPDSQGCFTIGVECAKKIPREYVYVPPKAT